MVVSSAYRSTADIVSCSDKSMSLMKNKNNKGPKMDPWGTPQLTIEESGSSLFIVTRWVLLSKYDLNHDRQGSLHL